MKPVTWLGLDSALSAYGFAVMQQTDLSGPRVVEAGTWSTRRDAEASTKSADTGRRIDELTEQLIDLVDRASPDVAFIETLLLFPKGGLVTASALARVRGATEGALKAKRVPLYEFAPQALKRALCGTPKAQKSEVGGRVVQLYPSLRSLPNRSALDENATDAVAVAHLGACGEQVRWHLQQRLGQAVGT